MTLNVKDLKALAKERKIKGYYNLRKAELIELLSSTPTRMTPPRGNRNNSRLPLKLSKQNILKTPTSMNVKQLKALARERGIKGYCKLRKAQLIERVNDTPVVSRQRPLTRNGKHRKNIVKKTTKTSTKHNDVKVAPKTQPIKSERPIPAPRPIKSERPIPAPRPIKSERPIPAPRPVQTPSQATLNPVRTNPVLQGVVDSGKVLKRPVPRPRRISTLRPVPAPRPAPRPVPRTNVVDVITDYVKPKLEKLKQVFDWGKKKGVNAKAFINTNLNQLISWASNPLQKTKNERLDIGTSVRKELEEQQPLKIELIEDHPRCHQYEVTGNLNSNVSKFIIKKITDDIEMRSKIVYSFSCKIHRGGGEVVDYQKTLSNNKTYTGLTEIAKYIQDCETKRLDLDDSEIWSRAYLPPSSTVETPGVFQGRVEYLKIHIKVIHSVEPLMGCGPLPAWLRKRKCIHAIDDKNDNLCVWRCLAIAQRYKQDSKIPAKDTTALAD